MRSAPKQHLIRLTAPRRPLATDGQLKQLRRVGVHGGRQRDELVIAVIQVDVDGVRARHHITKKLLGCHGDGRNVQAGRGRRSFRLQAREDAATRRLFRRFGLGRPEAWDLFDPGNAPVQRWRKAQLALSRCATAFA
jgi:hypothetical protein